MKIRIAAAAVIATAYTGGLHAEPSALVFDVQVDTVVGSPIGMHVGDKLTLSIKFDTNVPLVLKQNSGPGYRYFFAPTGITAQVSGKAGVATYQATDLASSYALVRDNSWLGSTQSSARYGVMDAVEVNLEHPFISKIGGVDYDQGFTMALRSLDLGMINVTNQAFPAVVAFNPLFRTIDPYPNISSVHAFSSCIHVHQTGPDDGTLPECTDGSFTAHITGSGKNPFVGGIAKHVYASYLDLWTRVQDQLELASYAVDLSGKNRIKDLLTDALAKAAELLAPYAGDPRYAAKVTEITGLMLSLQSALEVIDNLGGVEPGEVNPQFKLALELSKFSVSGLVKVSQALVADPPRFDYSTVTAPQGAPDLSDFFGPPSDGMTAAQLGLAGCSGAIQDGLRVSLLAAERAWGAYLDGDTAAVALQKAAYAAGSAEANNARVTCSEAWSAFRSAALSEGLGGVDMSALPQDFSSLSADDRTLLLGLLASDFGYFADDAERALNSVLAGALPQGSGNFEDFLNALGRDFDSIPFLPLALEDVDGASIPEPATCALVFVALAGMLVSRRPKL